MAVDKHPNYWLVWAALAFLTFIEIFIAGFSWSKTAIILTLLALAIYKAVLVALYFMHLRYEGNRLRIFVLAPLPLTIIIVIAGLTEYVW
jgi:cytochrome c oxidase subunit 4